MVEVFLVHLGETFLSRELRVELGDLRKQLGAVSLVVVTETFEVLRSPSAELPSGTSFAFDPEKPQCSDPPDPILSPIPGPTYQASFNFEEYEDFPDRYSRIPIIEKAYFALQMHAMEAGLRAETDFARFRMMCYVMEKRMQAAYALLQAALRGVKAVKRQVRECIDKAEALEKVQELQSIREKLIGKSLALKESLHKPRSQLRTASGLILKRTNLLRDSLTRLHQSPVLHTCQGIRDAMVTLKNRYVTVRETVMEILDTHRAVPNRSEKARFLLGEESGLGESRRMVEEVEKVAVEMRELISRASKESETTRQAFFQAQGTAAVCTKLARVKILLRLPGLLSSIDNYNIHVRVLASQTPLFEQCREEEVARQQQVARELQETADRLRSRIAAEKSRRERFALEQGELIPADCVRRKSAPRHSEPLRASQETLEALARLRSRLQDEIKAAEGRLLSASYALHQVSTLNENLQNAITNKQQELCASVDLLRFEQQSELYKAREKLLLCRNGI